MDAAVAFRAMLGSWELGLKVCAAVALAAGLQAWRLLHRARATDTGAVGSAPRRAGGASEPLLASQAQESDITEKTAQQDVAAAAPGLQPPAAADAGAVAAAATPAVAAAASEGEQQTKQQQQQEEEEAEGTEDFTSIRGPVAAALLAQQAAAALATPKQRETLAVVPAVAAAPASPTALPAAAAAVEEVAAAGSTHSSSSGSAAKAPAEAAGAPPQAAEPAPLPPPVAVPSSSPPLPEKQQQQPEAASANLAAPPSLPPAAIAEVPAHGAGQQQQEQEQQQLGADEAEQLMRMAVDPADVAPNFAAGGLGSPFVPPSLAAGPDEAAVLAAKQATVQLPAAADAFDAPAGIPLFSNFLPPPPAAAESAAASPARSGWQEGSSAAGDGGNDDGGSPAVGRPRPRRKRSLLSLGLEQQQEQQQAEAAADAEGQQLEEEERRLLAELAALEPEAAHAIPSATSAAAAAAPEQAGRLGLRVELPVDAEERRQQQQQQLLPPHDALLQGIHQQQQAYSPQQQQQQQPSFQQPSLEQQQEHQLFQQMFEQQQHLQQQQQQQHPVLFQHPDAHLPPGGALLGDPRQHAAAQAAAASAVWAAAQHHQQQQAAAAAMAAGGGTDTVAAALQRAVELAASGSSSMSPGGGGSSSSHGHAFRPGPPGFSTTTAAAIGGASSRSSTLPAPAAHATHKALHLGPQQPHHHHHAPVHFDSGGGSGGGGSDDSAWSFTMLAERSGSARSSDMHMPRLSEEVEGVRYSVEVDVPLACKLDVVSGPCSNRSYTNTEDVLEIIIGRNQGVTMPLIDGEISGQHAAVRWSSVDKCWKVADLGSLNGTLLNGEPISVPGRKRGRDYRLSTDDILQLGSFTKVKVSTFPRDLLDPMQSRCGSLPVGSMPKSLTMPKHRIPSFSSLLSPKITNTPSKKATVAAASDELRLECCIISRTGRDHQRKGQTCEDVACAECPLHGAEQALRGNPAALFCVFDGHCGRGAADAASIALPDEVSTRLEGVQDALQRGVGAEDMLRQAFLATDQAINSEEGCTATAVLMWRDAAGAVCMQTANVGDSAALFIDPDTGVAEELTEDHRLTNPRERQRLQEMGIQLASNARRLYGLNLCRGLGDKFLKDEDLGLSAEPYVSGVVQLSESQGGILMIASDGLWDVAEAEAVTQAILQADREKDGSVVEITNAVIGHALKNRTKDDVTALVVRIWPAAEWELRSPTKNLDDGQVASFVS